MKKKYNVRNLKYFIINIFQKKSFPIPLIAYNNQISFFKLIILKAVTHKHITPVNIILKNIVINVDMTHIF